MPKMFSSIFVKLMVVILVAGLGINLALILFFGAFRHHVAGSYHPHLNRYVNYLLKDIGNPPSQSRAMEIAKETNMVITYEGKDQNWTTSKKPIKFPTHRMHIWHSNGHLQAGSHHGTYMVSVKQAGGQLTFLLPHQSDAEKKIKVISVCLLLLISVLMVGAYLVIRSVLKPLRWLKQGVDQVAMGDLSHRVPLKRPDELRDLSASFNTMTERLQHLISSKEQLLLDVSHELRSPVTRMKVALAMMPASKDKVSISEDLDEIEQKITELLETARALNIEGSLNYTEVDLPELIRKTAKRFEAGKPPVRVGPMPDTAPIRMDAERIGQVLKNILDNARKYSTDGADPIQISLEIEASKLIISIEDHGIGISKQDQGFIFEPFYRADKARTPQRDGFGLGLSLANNIVKAHGGEITIQSQLGHGTTVQIHLPR